MENPLFKKIIKLFKIYNSKIIERIPNTLKLSLSMQR